MDDIEKIKLSLEELDNAGIFELRTVARSVGVKSPTIFKKNELIEKIKNVVSGETKPCPPSLRGRPVKELCVSSSDFTYNQGGQFDSRCQSYGRELSAKGRFSIDSEFASYSIKPDCKLHSVSGILEILPNNYGFLYKNNSLFLKDCIFVNRHIVKRCSLRCGDFVEGLAGESVVGDKLVLSEVESINDESVDSAAARKKFENLTPVFPKTKFNFTSEQCPLDVRIVDIVAPIGRGQRGIVLSKKNGDGLSFLKKIVEAILKDSADTQIVCALINEKPEAITEFKRIRGIEVYSSTFEKPANAHIRTAEIALERAKRLVEIGKEVVLVVGSVDNISKFQSISAEIPESYGDDSINALSLAKKIFVSAMNIELGGSLTVLTTAEISSNGTCNNNVTNEIINASNWKVGLADECDGEGLYKIDFNNLTRNRNDLNKFDISRLKEYLTDNDTAESNKVLRNLLSKTSNNEAFFKNYNKILAKLPDKEQL